MIIDRRPSAIRNVLTLISVLITLFVSACGTRATNDAVTQGSPTNNSNEALDSNSTPPQDGKQRLPAPPQNALLGLVYINTIDNREWIYDGRQWVPHDSSVDEYYRGLQANTVLSMQMKVLPAVPISSASTSIGAHITHIQAGYICLVCHGAHDSANIVTFDPNGPAVSPGRPSPGFDSAAKSCSNISCHGMYSGTFSYFFPGGDGVPVLETISYYSNNGSTPSWYVSGIGCNGCHDNPPRPAGATPVWHNGSHVGGNDCQLCHPDATGSGGAGTAITDPSLHVNGVVNVQTIFSSACFNCH